MKGEILFPLNSIRICSYIAVREDVIILLRYCVYLAKGLINVGLINSNSFLTPGTPVVLLDQ